MPAIWTPRMQEVAEHICRYALETGELPTLSEVARRMGLSRTRALQIWFRIEQYERGRRHREAINYDARFKARYLLRVLKDIEKAARMAGRVYPWKTRWQGPRQAPRDNPRRASNWSYDYEPLPPVPRWDWRPRFGDLIECKDCHGTAVQNGGWCPTCKGEGTIGGT